MQFVVLPTVPLVCGGVAFYGALCGALVVQVGVAGADRTGS